MSNCMLAYLFSEKRIGKWKNGFIIQPKLDGVRCIATLTKDSVSLVTRNGEPILTVPHIEHDLLSYFPRDIIFDGEIYTHGMKFDDISGSLRGGTSTHLLNYFIFDLINSDTQYIRNIFLEGLRQFVIARGKNSLFFLPGRSFTNPLLIEEYYQSYLFEGYEGAILRNPVASYQFRRTNDMLKLKPQDIESYIVTGVSEEVNIHGTPKGTLGSLTCAALPLNKTDKSTTQFSVGSGFTHHQREVLWQIRSTLPGSQIVVKFQNLTPRGVPRFPIFVRFTSPTIQRMISPPPNGSAN